MSSDSARGAEVAPRWRATLIAVCVAQATAVVGFDFTLPFIPLYLRHDLGVHGVGQTALWAGLIGFGPAIPATIFGPVWGRLADRLGYRFMLLRAMLSASLLISCMAFVPSPAVLLVLRMIQGALTGTIFSAQALVAASTPDRETGRAMGLLQTSVYVGATLGPIGGGAIAELLGYRASFVAAGVLLAVATSVVFLFVQEPPSRRVAQAADTGSHPSVLSVLLVPAFAGALALTLIVQLANTALLPIIPLFVEDLVHGSHYVATDTGWVMALSGVTGAIGAYSLGRLQRRLGLRRLIVVCLFLSVCLLFPQAFVGSYLSFLLLRGAAAFAFGGLFGLVGTWAAYSSPREAKGTAFGLMGAASSLGFGAGPLLGGALAAGIGIRPVFVLSSVTLGLLPAVLFGTAALVPMLLRGTPLRRLRSAEEAD